MKKVISFVLCLTLCCSVALAEVDLSGMSFDELVALKDQLNLAIWKSQEWQEVTVPAGLYQIGRDIPAGRWVIKPAEGFTARVSYGARLTKDKMDFDGMYSYEQITSPKDSYSRYNNIESVTLDLQDGYYIMIQDSKVVFEPFSGFGFSFK